MTTNARTAYRDHASITKMPTKSPPEAHSPRSCPKAAAAMAPNPAPVAASRAIPAKKGQGTLPPLRSPAIYSLAGVSTKTQRTARSGGHRDPSRGSD